MQGGRDGKVKVEEHRISFSIQMKRQIRTHEHKGGDNEIPLPSPSSSIFSTSPNDYLGRGICLASEEGKGRGKREKYTEQ